MHNNPIHTRSFDRFPSHMEVIAKLSMTAAASALRLLQFRTSAVKYALIAYERLKITE